MMPPGTLSPRVRALCELSVATAREFGGRHEYDGKIQDLSREGVRAGLAELAAAAAASRPLPDEHDEAHLAVFERAARVALGDLELHRRNPLWHLANLDLACYDRDYAAAADRDRAKCEHLAAWPRAVAAATDALDLVPAPVASALRGAVAGLAAAIPAGAEPRLADAARSAHERLVAHLDLAAAEGAPAALGEAALAELLSSSEGLPVDLAEMSARADAERDRLAARLAADCARIDPRREPLELARELVRAHPGAGGVVAAARRWTRLAVDFTNGSGLVPETDGECLVGLAPESRRWAMAMMSPAAPGEPDGPSWYHITPPDPAWPADQAEEWLQVFSDTTLPAITVHEVAPGHFTHARALRRVSGEVRRTLHSEAFIEGWAHYAEELCVEAGFRAGDPRFAIGVWLEALVRVTRLAVAIGVHAGGMSVPAGARRFAADTHLSGPAALAEASRATFDPTYGRYTWGKLEILEARARAQREWGAGFSLPRFHAALLDLGSPPLGLLGTALARG